MTARSDRMMSRSDEGCLTMFDRVGYADAGDVDEFSRRVIVNVATGPYVRGQERMINAFPGFKRVWRDRLPNGSPDHSSIPYAFKAYALKQILDSGDFTTVLWCDATMMPGPAPIERLWERIEEKGYWLSRNGYRNSEWTANSALQYLGVSAEENDQIEHIVAGAIGLDLRKSIAQEFLAEYFRLANNGAFCGPWTGGKGVQHRHDQTAASVVAWRLGMELTNPPAWLSYKSRECPDTVLVVTGV